MELSIPILYENKPVGTVSAEQDGLYTVYTAACTVPGLRRLRLSRLERSRLPSSALFAAEEHSVFPELKEAQEEPPEQEQTVPVPGEGDVLWHAGPDGTLYAVDGAQAWIAIPEAHADLPPEARRLLREIDGARYLVFPQ